ncbi:thiamine phosphate synthase [Pseudarthrobacter sp. H2]|uniref:thiamine phosphate synthase n=1 Tax=Pseudarthrobacter sp. H2 TaxID=3418415 RepID=UPI003CF5AAC1
MTGAGRTGFTAGIYLITDDQLCGERGVVETVSAAVAGGVRMVQIREKTASAARFYDLVMRTADAVGDRATVLVDDRVDVFLAARAGGAAVHGVHIGQSDLPAPQVRAIVGQDALIGLSANTAAHLAQLHALPSGTVDYLGVGVIRPTSTKPDHPAPLGIQGFAAIAAATLLPCVAIGGITPADVRALRCAGAAGIAVISAICAAENPARSAKEFLKEWTQ